MDSRKLKKAMAFAETKAANYKRTCSIDQCGEVFRSRNEYEKHQTDAHCVKYYPCRICKMQLYTFVELNKHHQDVHDEFNKDCPFCGKESCNKGTLREHVHSVHCRERGAVENELINEVDREDFEVCGQQKLLEILHEVGISDHFNLLKNKFSLQGFDNEEMMARWNLQSFVPAKASEMVETTRYDWVDDCRLMIDDEYQHLQDPAFPALNCVRGHLSSVADNSHTREGLKESYKLSNAVPMTNEVNSGSYLAAENLRSDLNSFGWEVIKLCGPLFRKLVAGKFVEAKKVTVPGGYDVRKPFSFYMIYLLRRRNFQPVYVAFIIPNEVDHKILFQHKATIEEIAALSDIAFFTKLVPAPLPLWSPVIRDKLFRCTTCSKSFISYKLLMDHKKSHSIELKCSICRRKFADKTSLEDHKNTHYKFNCNVCSRICTSRSLLEHHMKIHADKKEFVCEECGHGFTIKQHLTEHMVRHTRERPFSCHLCDTKFAYNNSLLKHRLTCDGEKPQRRMGCGDCSGCKIEDDCNACPPCLNKKLKQKCVQKRCLKMTQVRVKPNAKKRPGIITPKNDPKQPKLDNFLSSRPNPPVIDRTSLPVVPTSSSSYQCPPKTSETDQTDTGRETALVCNGNNNNNSKMPIPFVQGPLREEDAERISGRRRGIQGHRNSCYLDATLFAMFSFSGVFDSTLLQERNSQKDDGDEELARNVQRILRVEVVNPLRKELYCTARNVMKLRETMQHLDDKLTSQEMDAQEFLVLLFNKVFNLDGFTTLSSGFSEYFHQIIIDRKDEDTIPTTQKLLKDSFDTQTLKLKTIPHPALILQMPRSGNNLKLYERILPKLTIDITEQMEDRPESSNGVTPRVTMDLFAVICFAAHHYVSFVKCGTERRAPWVLFDSMADRLLNPDGSVRCYIPQVKLLPDMGIWLDELEESPEKISELESPELRRLLSDVYICLYSPQS